MLGNLTSTQKTILISSLLTTAIAMPTFIVVRRAVVRKRLKEQIIPIGNVSIPQVFSIANWQSGSPTLSDMSARTIAAKINDSFGWVYDDRLAILNELMKAKNRDDISLISYQFDSLFSENLAQKIEDSFSKSDTDMQLLLQFLSKL
jgi:hypothetical protein